MALDLEQHLTLHHRHQMTVIEGQEREAVMTNSKKRKRTKLCGRSREIDRIVEAYERSKRAVVVDENGSNDPKSHLVLISGPTGCGKTALANVLRDTVMTDDGFFVSLDFDQSNHLQIGGGFRQSFRGFARDVFSRGPHVVDYIRSQFSKALNNKELAVLKQLFPTFEVFLTRTDDDDNDDDDDDSLEESIPSELEKSGMSHIAFQAFFRAVGSRKRPLVQVLNNWQWADPNAIHYWTTLIDNLDDQTQGILFVATCNNSEVDGSSPHWEFAKQILFESDQIELTLIELANLSEPDFNTMIADALDAPLEQIDKEMLQVGFQITRGNPRFALELLLNDDYVEQVDNLWRPRTNPNEWQIESLDTLLRTRIESLPEHLRNTLQLCSCFGRFFKVENISVASSVDVSETLQDLTRLGFLHSGGDGRYTFANSSIQGVAYNSFSNPSQRSAAHFLIGSRLVEHHLERDTLDHDLLLTTGQLLLGSASVGTYDEKLSVALLFKRAAIKCITLNSFHAARRCLDAAIQLFDCNQRSFWRDEYDLAVALHSMSAEVLYAVGQNDDAAQHAQAVMARSRCLNDRLVAISTNLCVLSANRRPAEALALGLATLESLGEKFPNKQPTRLQVSRAVIQTMRAVKGKSKEALLRLPRLTDQSVAERLRLINILIPIAFRTMTNLVPILTHRSVSLSLQHGVNALSSLGFAVLGVQLCVGAGRYELGYDYGLVALGLLDRFPTIELIPRVHLMVYGCIQGFTKPLWMAQGPKKHAYRVGLESGDIESAIINIGLYNSVRMFHGVPLKTVYNDNMRVLRELACVQQGTTVSVRRSQANALKGQRTINAIVEALAGIRVPVDSDDFVGNEEAFYLTAKLVAEYVLDNHEEAVRLGSQQLHHLNLHRIEVSVFHTAYAMACLALHKKNGHSRKLLVAARRKAKMIDKLALKAQEFCLPKKHLLRAELQSLSSFRGRKQRNKWFDETLQVYNCAIALASKAGLLMEEAIAYEAGARFMADCGKSPVVYLEKAQALYVRWGATVKADQLQSKLASLRQLERRPASR